MQEHPAPTTLIAAALWRRIDVPAYEHSRLLRFSDGYIIDGRVITLVDGRPAEAHYMVVCDTAWVTRQGVVTLVEGADTRHIEMRRDEDGRWWENDRARPDLDGLVDIDLALTPATNTVAIRRLNLDAGSSGAATAAWVRFPGLTVEPLAQRYTRLDASTYRYESNGGAFTAELDVDETGMVVRYGNIWERVAPLPTPPGAARKLSSFRSG